MKDKFSVFQANGFWGIIEDNSDWKQSSVKSYIGPNLIVKRLNEQADQIDQLQQQLAEKDKEIIRLELQLAETKETIRDLEEERNVCDKARIYWKGNQTQLAIQELKKLRKEIAQNISPVEFSYSDYVKYVHCNINRHIKALKGEKDVKD